MISILLAAVTLAVAVYALNHNDRKEKQHAQDIEDYRAHINELQDAVKDAQQKALESFEAWKATYEKSIRKDAVDRSRRVMRGQATEHLAPYVMEGMDPKDFRFIGDPIDFIVCQGSSAVSDGARDDIERILILDINTGDADLSKVKRRISDAVIKVKVTF